MKDLQAMMNKRRKVQPVDAFDLPRQETEEESPEATALPAQLITDTPEQLVVDAIPHTPPIAESQPEPAAATPKVDVAIAQNQPIATEPETVIAIAQNQPVAPSQSEEIAIIQSETVATENNSIVATTRQTTIAISREDDDAFSHQDTVAIYDDKIGALKRAVEEVKEFQKEAAKEIQSMKKLKRVQGPSRKLHNALIKLPETPQTALAIEMVESYTTLKKPGLNAPESFHMILGELAQQLEREARKTNPDARVTATDLYQEGMLREIVRLLKKMGKQREESPE